MPGTGIYLYPRDDLLVISVDKGHLTRHIQLDHHPHIPFVKSAGRTVGCPRGPHKIIVILFLDPEMCVGEKPHPIDIVPMRMTEDYIRNIPGLQSHLCQRRIRPDITRDLELLSFSDVIPETRIQQE